MTMHMKKSLLIILPILLVGAGIMQLGIVINRLMKHKSVC